MRTGFQTCLHLDIPRRPTASRKGPKWVRVGPPARARVVCYAGFEVSDPGRPVATGSVTPGLSARSAAAWTLAVRSLLAFARCASGGLHWPDATLAGVDADIEPRDQPVAQVAGWLLTQGGLADQAARRGGDVVALVVGLLEDLCGGRPVA